MARVWYFCQPISRLLTKQGTIPSLSGKIIFEKITSTNHVLMTFPEQIIEGFPHEGPDRNNLGIADRRSF